MENFEEALMLLIREKSGINVNYSHRTFILKFIENRIKELGISHAEYLNKIDADKSELILLIDEAAINETYFFREEKQFAFLERCVFKPGWKPVIWSAACSTGEEALSLYALAKHCGCDPKIYATDIDENAMSQMKNGNYPPHAFRTDGSTYFPMLSEIGDYHTKFFKTSSETLSKLHISRFNLITDESFPMQAESVDILFIRNVFIYFNDETRKDVIRKMCRALKNGGLLFISVNEIAGINCDQSIPLIKDHWESIYFFRKVSDDEKKDFVRKRCANYNSINVSERSFPQPVFGDFHADELYKKIKEKISEGNVNEAHKILSTASYRPDSAYLILYFNGLIEMERNNLDEAEKFFTKSSIMNADFWPALFKLGMSERKNNKLKPSMKTFSKCSELLKVYAKEQKMCYNFLMDSFSEDYFLKICESFLNEEEEVK